MLGDAWKERFWLLVADLSFVHEIERNKQFVDRFTQNEGILALNTEGVRQTAKMQQNFSMFRELWAKQEGLSGQCKQVGKTVFRPQGIGLPRVVLTAPMATTCRGLVCLLFTATTASSTL